MRRSKGVLGLSASVIWARQWHGEAVGAEIGLPINNLLVGCGVAAFSAASQVRINEAADRISNSNIKNAALGALK